MAQIPTRPDPRSRALKFCFEGTECLYRDHYGQRVIADVEGRGEFSIVRADASLSTQADDDLFKVEPGPFRHSLVVTADGPGLAEVRVNLWPTVLDLSSFQDVKLPFEGSGWLLASDEPCTLDDSHELGGIGPFHWKAAGQCAARVVAAGPPAVLIDSFSIADSKALLERSWRVQNVSSLQTLRSTFADGSEREGPVASHLNAASWICPIPERCGGLIVRKVYDRFHGRQRARLLVDGAMAGWWYEPREDRSRRWGVSQFGIPAEMVEGKPSVEISVDPPAGSPLWSVSEIEIFALTL